MKHNEFGSEILGEHCDPDEEHKPLFYSGFKNLICDLTIFFHFLKKDHNAFGSFYFFCIFLDHNAFGSFFFNLFFYPRAKKTKRILCV